MLIFRYAFHDRPYSYLYLVWQGIKSFVNGSFSLEVEGAVLMLYPSFFPFVIDYNMYVYFFKIQRKSNKDIQGSPGKINRWLRIANGWYKQVANRLEIEVRLELM